MQQVSAEVESVQAFRSIDAQVAEGRGAIVAFLKQVGASQSRASQVPFVTSIQEGDIILEGAISATGIVYFEARATPRPCVETGFSEDAQQVLWDCCEEAGLRMGSAERKPPAGSEVWSVVGQRCTQ
jgi:hypothetical protein